MDKIDKQILNQIKAYSIRQLEKKILKENKKELYNEFILYLDKKQKKQRERLEKELEEFKNDYSQWKKKSFTSSIRITKAKEERNETQIVLNTKKSMREDETNNRELYRFKTKLGIYVLKESNEDELIRPRERLKNIPLSQMNRTPKRPNKLDLIKCY